MKNKLKKTIMETTDWIEKIKEAVHVAIDKKVEISTSINSIYIYYKCRGGLSFYINNDLITISTPKGFIKIDHSLTDREKLEIDFLKLSIKEYNENIAISEFEEFISEKKEEITDINDLDNDEE